MDLIRADMYMILIMFQRQPLVLIYYLMDSVMISKENAVFIIIILQMRLLQLREVSHKVAGPGREHRDQDLNGPSPRSVRSATMLDAALVNIDVGSI